MRPQYPHTLRGASCKTRESVARLRTPKVSRTSSREGAFARSKTIRDISRHSWLKCLLMELRNQVVWVTGASQGIGRATAEAFAAAGSDVVLTARTEVILQAT